MSQTSLSVKSFKNVACLMPPWVSMLLRANHGVGKSKVVRQVAARIRDELRAKIKEGGTTHDIDGVVIDLAQFKAAALEAGFMPVIDRRLSQMSEGDMIGLPSTDGETTRFNPPDWYKLACRVPCVLFLDEINRATPEVMQAAFQIVLDRELNGHKLHPLTRVFAAVNTGAAYTVNEMDPALLDRFFTIDLMPSVEEFIAWARDTDPVQGGNLNPVIPDFISAQKTADGGTWLYPAKNAEASSVQPSPRSWEALNKAMTYAKLIDNPQNETFHHMAIGFVGVEAAIAFRDFARSVDNRINGEEIVNEYHLKAVAAKIKRMGQGRQNDIVEKAAAYVVGSLDTLTEQQGKNIKQLITDLPEELRISLWAKLTSQGIAKVELAKAVHKYCGELVLTVFGVKMGQAGIGMTPNIPGIFTTPAADSTKK